MLFHRHGNDFKLLCNKFPGYKRAYASLRTFLPFSAFPSFPLANGGHSTPDHQSPVAKKTQRDQFQEGNQKSGRMRWVCSTDTTPPGDSRGQRWTNKAGMNYCIYTLQKIQSWSLLKGNHRIFFLNYTLWFDKEMTSPDQTDWARCSSWTSLGLSVSESMIMNLIIMNILCEWHSFVQQWNNGYEDVNGCIQVIFFFSAECDSYVSLYPGAVWPDPVTSHSLQISGCCTSTCSSWGSASHSGHLRPSFKGMRWVSREASGITQRPTTAVKRPRLNWFCSTDEFCGFSSGIGNQS